MSEPTKPAQRLARELFIQPMEAVIIDETLSLPLVLDLLYSVGAEGRSDFANDCKELYEKLTETTETT